MLVRDVGGAEMRHHELVKSEPDNPVQTWGLVSLPLLLARFAPIRIAAVSVSPVLITAAPLVPLLMSTASSSTGPYPYGFL